MKWLVLWVIAGCAGRPWQRALPASFVPALELRASYRASELVTGAWLRWTPRTAASAVMSRVDQLPASWLAPCSLEDVTCLSEVAEAEPEIASALRERP